MINTELLKDGTLIRHYSDKGMLIKQNETDILYSEAIDIIPCPFSYEETDIPIPVLEITDHEEIE